jgi:hypothetical protein
VFRSVELTVFGADGRTTGADEYERHSAIEAVVCRRRGATDTERQVWHAEIEPPVLRTPITTHRRVGLRWCPVQIRDGPDRRRLSVGQNTRVSHS